MCSPAHCTEYHTRRQYRTSHRRIGESTRSWLLDPGKMNCRTPGAVSVPDTAQAATIGQYRASRSTRIGS
eukprot:3221838-Rhodomonas_salina.5